jgi:sec-independent protein translocase protein TatA
MLPSIGVPELIIILVIVLIIFGAGKLADIGGALGKGIKEFRKASREADETAKELQADDSKTDTPKADSAK